jgi:hypothetical protein
MAADYRHIGGFENRLGRHYSRFFAFWPARPLQVNHLPCENCAMLGRIGEVGLERSNCRHKEEGPRERRQTAIRAERPYRGGFTMRNGGSANHLRAVFVS